ncbi:MAG: amidohydrolase family protein, partial [Erysipelotrichaceae bacterium]|nr:amidohydrolase family protein [Erysipelotrichaceae bacterium]
TDTGCPYITHYDMWREVYYLQKYAGVSNEFALYSATLGNARIIGMENEIGSLAAGKCADLIVTEENPLEDLKALRHVSMVVSRGRIVDVSGLRKYPECERQLDRYL